MLESGPNKLTDVVVRKRIEDVLPVAAVLHDPLAAKHLELLRERRELGPERLGELGHTKLTPPELFDQAHTMLVASRAEQRGRPRERLVGDRRARARAGVRVGSAIRGLLTTFFHFNEC